MIWDIVRLWLLLSLATLLVALLLRPAPTLANAHPRHIEAELGSGASFGWIVTTDQAWWTEAGGWVPYPAASRICPDQAVSQAAAASAGAWAQPAAWTSSASAPDISTTGAAARSILAIMPPPSFAPAAGSAT